MLKLRQVIDIFVDHNPIDYVKLGDFYCIGLPAYQRSSFVLWLATSSLEKTFDIMRRNSGTVYMANREWMLRVWVENREERSVYTGKVGLMSLGRIKHAPHK